MGGADGSDVLEGLDQRSSLGIRSSLHMAESCSVLTPCLLPLPARTARLQLLESSAVGGGHGAESQPSRCGWMEELTVSRDHPVATSYTVLRMLSSPFPKKTRGPRWGNPSMAGAWIPEAPCGRACDGDCHVSSESVVVTLRDQGVGIICQSSEINCANSC